MGASTGTHSGESAANLGPALTHAFSMDGMQDQVINFGSIPDHTYGDPPFIVSATGGGSGNPVTFSTDGNSTPNTCTSTGANGSTITLTGAGTCVVDANQAGNGNYNAAPQVQQSFTIDKANDSITFGSIADHNVNDPPFTVSATGGGSSSPVTFSVDGSSTPNACGSSGPNGSTITLIGIGTCVVDANQAGDSNYNDAPQVQQAFNVDNEQDQSINFGPIPDHTYGDGPFSVNATGGGSSNPVTFSIDGSSTPNACTSTDTNGMTITITGAGTCVVDANQAGDGNFNGAQQVQQSFTINKAAATITIDTGTLNPTYDGSPKPVTATTGAAGYTVTYNGSGTAPTEAGSYTVVATIVDPNYQGSDSATETIQPANQSISFGSIADHTYGDAAFVVSAGGGGSGNPVTFSIDGTSTANACTSSGTNGSTISITGVGSCVVDADQAGTNDYNAAPEMQQSFTIAQATESLHIVTGSLTRTYDGSAKPVTVTASPCPADTVTYNGSSSAPTAAGSYTVLASNSDTTDCTAGSDTETETVNKANQTISGFGTIPDHTFGDGAFSVSGTGGGSGNPVTFGIDGSSTANACTSSGTHGSTITITGAGTCDVDANQAGNNNYNDAAQVQQSFTINQATGAISINAGSLSQTYDGSPKAVTVTTNAGSYSVTYNGSSTPPTHAGSYTVVATDTDSNFTAASDTKTEIIGKATPQLSWAKPASITYGIPLTNRLPICAPLCGGVDLDAQASVAGTFTYSPPVGTVLNAGVNQPLSATFTPADSTDYTSGGHVGTTITVKPRSLTITGAVSLDWSDLLPNLSLPAYWTAFGYANHDTNAVLTTPPTCSSIKIVTGKDRHVNVKPGNYPVITCKGAVASNYAISYHIGTLTVLREDVGFVYDGATGFTHGATVKLRAVLEADALSTQKVNGQKVTLGFKGARGCTTTTSSGVATCSIKAPAKTGPAMVFMSYAGNTYHLADTQLVPVTIN